eukprot:948510-Prymnesium_polylepis.1
MGRAKVCGMPVPHPQQPSRRPRPRRKRETGGRRCIEHMARHCLIREAVRDTVRERCLERLRKAGPEPDRRVPSGCRA